MIDVNFINLLVFVLAAGSILYRISFLSRKTIGYLSLQQLIVLVFVPGFVFVIAYSYLQDILARPLNKVVFIPDNWLINVFLLSSLFTYGGLAIHSVTKMLADLLRHEKSKIAEINKHFHLVFSHNLVFIGILFLLLSITLLEMNHVNLDDQNNLFILITKGLLLGIIFLLTLRYYTKSEDEYSGNWSDFKIFFAVVWMSLVLLFYGIKKTNPSFRNYDLILTSLTIFVLLAIANMFLVYKRLKKGGFQLFFGLGKKKEKIWELH